MNEMPKVGDKIRIHKWSDVFGQVRYHYDEQIFEVGRLWDSNGGFDCKDGPGVGTNDKWEIVERADDCVEISDAISYSLRGCRPGGVFIDDFATTATHALNYMWQEENNSLIKKTMSVVKNVFKSKENKALEHFGLGTKDDLNRDGLMEFLSFIYETDSLKKEDFLKKMVEAYEEKNK